MMLSLAPNYHEKYNEGIYDNKVLVKRGKGEGPM